MSKVMALVVFSGDLPYDELDVDRAALELQQAGYKVTRLPDKLGGRLLHPLDDFMEVAIEFEGLATDDVIDTIWHEIDDIVDPYGGLVGECGVLEAGHVPFADYFAP
ncbi:MAG TPA: hypothetical protein VGJ20_27880 [Xanthobacteraceae bacterium]|jgi:hypothetical protein